MSRCAKAAGSLVSSANGVMDVEGLASDCWCFSLLSPSHSHIERFRGGANSHRISVKGRSVTRSRRAWQQERATGQASSFRQAFSYCFVRMSCAGIS